MAGEWSGKYPTLEDENASPVISGEIELNIDHIDYSHSNFLDIPSIPSLGNDTDYIAEVDYLGHGNPTMTLNGIIDLGELESANKITPKRLKQYALSKQVLTFREGTSNPASVSDGYFGTGYPANIMCDNESASKTAYNTTDGNKIYVRVVDYSIGRSFDSEKHDGGTTNKKSAYFLTYKLTLVETSEAPV